MSADPLHAARGIVIAGWELGESFIRASGPGGQNVNKVATAVQLRFDIRQFAVASRSGESQCLKLGGSRVSKDGVLIIEANRFRTQERNRADARARLVELIDQASEPPPPPRRKTRPTRGSVERRLPPRPGGGDQESPRQGYRRLELALLLVGTSDSRVVKLRTIHSGRRRPMGIFDFIKSAGKKLGIGGDDDAPDADAVKKELDSHKLGTDKVDVKVEGDKIVLSGVVEDQSIFEKAIVAVGNTLGISKVEASELKVVIPDSGLSSWAAPT
jgi:ribosome-associated protein